MVDRLPRLPWRAWGPGSLPRGCPAGVGPVEEPLGRLDLAWLTLKVKALAGGRQAPSPLLRGRLDELPEDGAVTLLQAACYETAIRNYTEYLLAQLGRRRPQGGTFRFRSGGRWRCSAGPAAAADADGGRAGIVPRGAPGWAQRLRLGGAGFLVVTPRFGLGNRLLGIASAGALALTLNRTLVVLWEEPSFAGLLAPLGAPPSAMLHALGRHGARRLDALSSAPIAGAEALACGGGGGGGPAEAGAGAAHLLGTPRVLQVETDGFFLPLLHLGEAGSRRQEALRAALQDPGDSPQAAGSLEELARWSGQLLRGAFFLQPAMQAEADAELSRLLGGARFVLGVHVRTRMFDWEETMVPLLGLDAVFDCVETALEAEGPKGSSGGSEGDALIFLASPSQEVKEAARLRFGERLRTRDEVAVDRITEQSDAEALLDLALLAASDALVTSVRSTYSYVAQSLASVPTYVVTEGSTSFWPWGPRCRRLKVPVPCYHAGELLAEALSCGPPPTRLREEYGGPWASCWY